MTRQSHKHNEHKLENYLIYQPQYTRIYLFIIIIIIFFFCEKIVMCSVPTVYSGPTSFMCSASQALLDYCVVPTIPDCYATVIYIYIYI